MLVLMFVVDGIVVTTDIAFVVFVIVPVCELVIVLVLVLVFALIILLVAGATLVAAPLRLMTMHIVTQFSDSIALKPFGAQVRLLTRPSQRRRTEWVRLLLLSR